MKITLEKALKRKGGWEIYLLVFAVIEAGLMSIPMFVDTPDSWQDDLGWWTEYLAYALIFGTLCWLKTRSVVNELQKKQEAPD